MTKPRPTVLRKGLKFLIAAVVAFLILISVLFTYATLKVRWAKKQIEAFDRLVVVGMPVAGLEKKADEMHLYYRRMTDSNDKDGRFVVWEGFVFGRWFCDVEYQNGKATKKSVTFLD